MTTKAISFVIVLLSILSLPVSLTSADSPVDPVLCIPSINILYSDFDRVNAQVFIPVACPIIGDGTISPDEVLVAATVTLQRRSVAPGESLDDAPITLVTSAVMDVTTITTMHDAALMTQTVAFDIVPSYTTSDYHRVIVEVHGTQGATTFADRAASVWLAMPPPPLEIGGFASAPTPEPRTTFGALLSSESSRNPAVRGG